MTAPINLTQLRHDIENAYLPDGWTEPLIALIDTAEAATNLIYESNIVSISAGFNMTGPRSELDRLRETLNRYTTTP